jgi:hypothetical protein
MWDIVVYPMLLYIIWQLLYIAVVRVTVVCSDNVAQTVIKGKSKTENEVIQHLVK